MLEEDKNNNDKRDSSSEDNASKKRRRIRVGDVNNPTPNRDSNREREPYRSSDESRIPNRTSAPRREYNSQNFNNTRSSNPPRERSSSYGYGDQRESQYGNQRSQGSSSYQRNDRRPYGGGERRTDTGRSFPQQRNSFSRSQEPAKKRLIKPVKYKENIDPTTEIRLNKYLANAGVCSRREADTHIVAGIVKVNGAVVSDLGTKVKYGDQIQFNDKIVEIESKVYVLLNKPKNCVTTSDDPQNRVTVMDLVKNACTERIYPVGRLDRNTTGVLLLTNDGDLASKLMHPKYKKKKIYQVTLDKDVRPEDMQAIADGIELDDGEIHADSIAYNSEDMRNIVGIEIHSGRNRIVRRIFEKLEYKIIKLDRVYFSGLTKKNVPRGKWRYLTADEVNVLRMGAFE